MRYNIFLINLLVNNMCGMFNMCSKNFSDAFYGFLWASQSNIILIISIDNLVCKGTFEHLLYEAKMEQCCISQYQQNTDVLL